MDDRIEVEMLQWFMDEWCQGQADGKDAHGTAEVGGGRNVGSSIPAEMLTKPGLANMVDRDAARDHSE